VFRTQAAARRASEDHVAELNTGRQPLSGLTLGDWMPQPAAIPHNGRVPTLQELEREHIINVLELTRWVVSGEHGAAKLLGLKATSLEARLKKLRIQRPR
jgi:formate hydrogenlyase transcriptional activator